MKNLSNFLEMVSLNSVSAILMGGLLGLAAQSYAEPNERGQGIGEATLVIGRAFLTGSEDRQVRLTKGTTIFPGDLIETLSSGHVHVRFIDEALLSVRPNSVLKIEEYSFDASIPQDSAVKFKLDEGVARAISGEAAKSARERFRLNTPIAAIGVRGTDFVVSAEPHATKALVNEGAIVIAPFSNTCRVEDLGPCIGNSLELARSGFEIAALQADEPMPRILPSQSIRAPDDALRRQVQLLVSGDSTDPANPLSSDQSGEVGDAEQQNLSNEVLIEGVTSPVVRSNAAVAAAKVSSTDFIPTDPIVVSVDGQVEQFDHTPPSPMTLKSLSDRQLVWGHYGKSALTSDRLALSFSDASSTRRISVGNLNYGLFRKDADPRRVASDLGLVGFQLTSAQAVFNSETGIAVMTVNGGSLDIDFQGNTFDTMLSLDHQLTGNIEFEARGRIFDGGFMRAKSADQFVAGAVSYDGAEAGYLFEKEIVNGSISGLTLWDSK